ANESSSERKPMTERQPIIDEQFTYRGLHADGAITRVRVYDTDPPIVIATELPENRNSSITNSAEYLWPAIMKAYLPHRMEHIPPAIFIEHYAASTLHGRSQPATYSEVRFDHPTPFITYQGRLPRLSYGAPTWKPI